MQCPYCNNEMEYVGVNDGGGDYGSAICDEYQCPVCDWIEETDCIEYDDEPSDGDMYPLEID